MTMVHFKGPQLIQQAQSVMERIAPLWPLDSFVAVNPYMGLMQSFWDAHEMLKRVVGQGLCMPREYYWQKMKDGRITHEDIATAIQEFGYGDETASIEQMLVQPSRSRDIPFKLLTDILGQIEQQDWSAFVVEHTSRYCAAYYDQGQALWSFPWKDLPLYTSWRQFVRYDKSPRLWGVKGFGEALDRWPDTAEGAIVQAIQTLDVPGEVLDDYLYAVLLSIGGWAGWTRYLRFQAELQGHDNADLQDLLAIRLSWEALLYQLKSSDLLKSRWREFLVQAAESAGHSSKEIPIDPIWQTALEIGYQRQLLGLVNGSVESQPFQDRAPVQAVFCIDVRSEVFRRAFETVEPGVQTLGFAGFFGIPMEYVRFGDSAGQAHLPVLFTPSYRIAESLNPDSERQDTKTLLVKRHNQLRLNKVWKIFKTSATSTFAFVESVGLLWAPKLISDSMGWTRPVPKPDDVGLSRTDRRRLQPQLSSESKSQDLVSDMITGIPEADRPALAESVLRNMGLMGNFARLVLLVGHGSMTVNNPQASALDCGACGGQSGEANARVAAALLNDPGTRYGLAQRGLAIPDDTYFLAGLHDTVTEELRLLNKEVIPSSHVLDVQQLEQWLKQAGQLARAERLSRETNQENTPAKARAVLWRRARDWAEVRPEWALAGNAAFIAAPRHRTRQRDLAGRAFLHEYDWHLDPTFSTLQQIMTAPMVVAQWINMQYYGSMVDPRRLGSGNKVLHNVTGGSVGVLEGNGGDLRAGLAWQSLHDGTRWMHEPMRLTVLIEAPREAIDEVIAHHDEVQHLVEDAWIYLFQIDDDGRIHRRGLNKQWALVGAQ